MIDQPGIVAYNRPPRGVERLVLEGELTAEHIAHGVRSSCTACPVALALDDLCRQYGIELASGPAVSADPQTCSIRLNTMELYAGNTPEPAENFMVYFDNHDDDLIAPFRLQLVLVPVNGLWSP